MKEAAVGMSSEQGECTGGDTGCGWGQPTVPAAGASSSSRAGLGRRTRPSPHEGVWPFSGGH